MGVEAQVPVGHAGLTSAATGRPRRGAALSSSQGTLALLAAITLAGLLLRLTWFRDALYGDELSTFYVVTGHGFGRVLHLLNGHNIELNPPLYFALTWLIEQFAGSSTQALRFVSLVSGVATIPLTYLLAKRTVGGHTPLVAATLVALSPFLVFYSSEARAYQLMVVLCLLSTLALLAATRTGRRRWWIAYAALSCAAVYAHFTSVFVLAAQFGWAFFAHPRARRPLLVANVSAAVVFIPWLPNLVRDFRSPLARAYGFLDPLNLHSVRVDLGRLAIGHPLVPISKIPGNVAASLALAGIVVAALGLLIRRTRERRSAGVTARPSRELALILTLALAGPVGVGIYSSVGHTIWDRRNLLASWPGFAILVAAVLTYPRLRWRLPALSLVVAALAIGAVNLTEARYHRPDYRAVAGYIGRVGTNGEPVVEIPDLAPGPLYELEAALSLDGSAARHPVLRLGAPPLSAVLRSPPNASLPHMPGQVVAREASRLAGGGGFFFVTPGFIPVASIEALRRSHVISGPRSDIVAMVDAFLGALPDRFRLVDVHTYPGINRPAVYTFRSTAGGVSASRALARRG